MTEQEFHNTRLPFYLDLDTLIVKTPPTKYRNTSHAKWFSDMGITFPHTVRGYYMKTEEDEYVMLYWNDFSVPNVSASLFSYIFSYFPTLKWIGLGCIIGNVGDIWKPLFKIYKNYGE